jgi:hypothetical protein
MMIVKKFFLPLFFFLGLFIQSSMLNACKWCFRGKISTFVQQVFSRNQSPDTHVDQTTCKQEAVDTNVTVRSIISPENLDESLEADEDIPFQDDHFNLLRPPGGTYVPTQEGMDFFEKGIYLYYPKVHLFKDVHFPTMCSVAIDAALREIANVLNFETWFFYINERKQFRWGSYWERIIKVCKIIVNYFERAEVDLRDLSVFKKTQAEIWEEFFCGKRSTVPSIKLTQYWKENGYTAYYDIYAIMFEYVHALFNEGIKFENAKKINKWFYRLERLSKKLVGSKKHQIKVEQAIKTAKRLRSFFFDRRKERRYQRMPRQRRYYGDRG